MRTNAVCSRFLSITLLSLLSSGALSQVRERGDRFVIGIHPRSVLVIDSARDEVIAQISTKGHTPKEMVPSPDGKRLYVTTEARQQIEVVNLASQKVEDVINLAPPGTRLNIYGMTLNRKADRLFVHVLQAALLPDEYRVLPPQIWSVDLRTHQKEVILEVPYGIVSLLAPADENRLIAWGRDIYLIDLAQKRVATIIPLMSGNPPNRAAMDTLPFFLQYEQSGIVSIPFFTEDPILKKELMGLANLHVDTGKIELLELGPAIPVYSSVVSPDHKRAYLVMNQLVVVDLENKKIVAVKNLERTKYVANISGDGKKLYLPSAGAFLDIYDTQTLQMIKRVPLPGDPGVSQFRSLPAAAMP
jgi:hypothetical protein